MNSVAFLNVATSIQFTVESAGALAAAQAGPTYTLYRNGTVIDTTSGSPAVTLTPTTPATGIYRVAFTIPAGWSAGDVVELLAATGTTGSGFVGRWVVLATIPHSAADVWAATTRTLSEFGFTVTTSNAADVTAIKAKTDTLPASPAAVGSAMTLDASAIVAIEAALLNDLDGQALIAAISAKVQTLFDANTDVPVVTLVAAIAAAILTNPANKIATDSSGQVTASNLPSVPTVDQIATRLLVTPANKLLTNSAGQVTATNGGGGGGSGSSFVMPLVSTSVERVTGNRVALFTRELLPVQLPIYDSAGDPVDCTGLVCDLVLANGTTVADLSPTGSPTPHIYTFTPLAGMVAYDRSLAFSLRVQGTLQVLAHGSLTVAYAP